MFNTTPSQQLLTYLRMCHSFTKMDCDSCTLHSTVHFFLFEFHIKRKIFKTIPFHRFNRAQLTILVGTNDLRKRGERFGVEKLIPHSEFSSSKRGKDIGLIRVQGSIKFNRLVQPIEYSKKSPPPNSMLRLSELWPNYTFMAERSSYL